MIQTTNPYRDADLATLGRACERMAGELLTPRSRSAEERGQLAQACAHLLLVAGRRIAPMPYHPGAPETEAASAPHRLADAFWSWASREQTGIRFHAAQRASECALGGAKAHLWRPSGFNPLAPPWESDAGLMATIAELQQLAK